MATSQFELRPAAVEIHCSDAQINEVFSGRRFGKTRLMHAAGLEMCLKNHGAEFFVWLMVSAARLMIPCGFSR